MENTQIKLSIVVPVYNVERYLKKCIDSLLNQDILSSQYEIILVDDGSPDMCPQICEEYKSMYNNIQVVHRENGGLSAARNSGIEIAQGEYIMFIDSDDYIERNVLSSLITRMDEEQLDILRYNFQNVDEYYEIFQPYKTSKPFVDYSSSVADGETFLNERLGAACYAWQFVLRTELVQREGNLFKPGIYFEDTEWTPRILLQAHRVASTNAIVYNYLWRRGSITLPTDPTKARKVLEDKISLLAGFEVQKKLAHDPKWFVWMRTTMTISIISILSEMPWKERNHYLERLNGYHLFPLTTFRAKGNNLHKVRLLNLSPALYCRFMRWWSRDFRQTVAQTLYMILNLIRFWPHLLAYTCSRNKNLISRDVAAYRAEYEKGNLLWFLTYNRSFRGLFYYRLGAVSRLISWLAPAVHELTIPSTVKIGEGLLLFHAYSTILNAHRIGDHCRILHMVTLGDKDGRVPVIGDHVTILSGAVIVGGIEIGDNCVIGPNAVVHKSVPANCVIVGNPAIILKQDGKIIKQPL